MKEIVQTFLETLRKTQFFPPDALVAYQRGLLENLVRHARTHVPFYRDSGRLDPLFRPDDSIDWDQWCKIPLLTRAEIQAAGTSLHSEFLPPGHGPTWPLSTSGTSGQRATVLRTYFDARYAWSAQMLRMLQQHRIDPTKRLIYISSVPTGKMNQDGTRRHASWFRGFRELGYPGERFDFDNSCPAKELVEAVVSLRPQYVYGQPVPVELMCAHDRERRLSGLGIKKVLTIGQHLSEGAKKEIGAHLECELVDIYASSECGLIASTCPHCGRYHVHAECGNVEIIADDGAVVEPGGTGWIVVTPFYNYGMPLIRYAHLDRALVSPADGCRITLPALTAILGKNLPPFRFRGGVVVPPTVPASTVVEYLGATTFRIVQIDDERCEFRLVPGRLRPDEMHFDAMTEYLRKNWWAGLHVDYRIFDQLPAASGGKLKLYDREVSDG